MFGMHGKVMDVPAATVMTTEDRTDYSSLTSAYKTHSGISLDESPDIFLAVGGAQSYAVETAPKGVDDVVIGEIKGFDEQGSTSCIGLAMSDGNRSRTGDST